MKVERAKIYLSVGAILGAAGSSWLLFAMIADRDLPWSLGGSAYLVGIGFSAWGMWRWRRWALWLSWVLAAVTFGIGCYFAHFVWTFWLFKEPTFWDRVRALLHPFVISSLAGSLLWLNYFARPSVRQQFQ